MATGSKCIFELKGNIIAKDEKYNIMVLDLTGVSGSLVVVAVVGMSRSALKTSSQSQVISFSTQVVSTSWQPLRCRTPLSEAVI